MTQITQNIFAQKAKLPQHFIIVGGGIAGLACAYTLQSAGHTVRVFEKSDGLGMMSLTGGIRSPPNMTRLLLRWGLGEKLKEVSTICSCMAMRSGGTTENLGTLYFHKEVMRELQANLILVTHADLYKLLYELVIGTGVRMDFNSKVVSIDPQTPSVVLSSGEEIKADIIVGADGGGSIVRSLVAGEPQVPKAGPFSIYATCIPIKLLDQDEELRKLIVNTAWNIFMADSQAIFIHVAGGGSQVTLTYLVDVRFSASPEWTNMISLSELDFSAFDQRLQRLMKLASHAHLVQHMVQEPLESWYHPSHKVLILGDAAHLTNPASTHCAALALEDATVLGSLFSHLSNVSQIPYFLSAFQDLRHARCQAVTTSEWGKVEACSLPAGEQQQLRDFQLRQQASSGLNLSNLDDAPEDYLREQCEEYRDSFGYDAHDDADNWWIEWGSLLERSMLLNSEREPRDGY